MCAYIAPSKNVFIRNLTESKSKARETTMLQPKIKYRQPRATQIVATRGGTWTLRL